MALDKVLKIYDENGNPVDYDILASDVKFLPDGKDLPTKLAEMEAHQGDGTVTGVKVGSDTYEPTEGVVDLSTPFSGKVDKNGTDSLMSAEEHTKLAGIEAGAEKNIIKGIKANGASTNLPVDQNGVVELPPAGSTISPADTAPQMDGTANVGSSAKYAREDHVHPHDTTKLSQSDVSVETQGDGTVDINVKDDTYTINLNHTHENMAKLIVCEESDLPSTLDNDTIYAITDSGETEIEKLIIRGMEFAGGGGTPSTEPKILSPIGTQIDFNGESTKTVTVRATNLSEALTIAVTGVTANLQTISVNDAANGVQLTLTKGQNFGACTLRIYSSEVDKSWGVIDSQGFQLLTAIKLTGSQWLKTDYVPKTTTEFEMLVKFGDRNTNNKFGAVLTTNVKPAPSGDPYLFRMNTDVEVNSSMGLYFGNAKSQNTSYGLQGFQNLTEQQMLSDNTLISYTLGTDTNNNPCGIFRFGSLTHFTSLQASDMDSPIMIGYGRTTNGGDDNIFNRYSLTIYRLTITEGGTTVHNYVPATRNGVPGLHDTVTGAFISSETSTPVVAIE